MIWTALLAISCGIARREHIGQTLLIDRLPAGLRRAALMLCEVLALGLFRVLGCPDTGGLFAVANSRKEIATLDDMKGVLLRMMTLPTHPAIMSARGLQACPLAFSEGYSGLQTGVIDGQVIPIPIPIPIPIIVGAALDEVQTFMTLTNTLHSRFTLLVNRDVHERLTETRQDVMHCAAQPCVDASCEDARGCARRPGPRSRRLSRRR